MLIPPFASNTKGAWNLRFDDILADALELGPLRNRDFELPEDVLRRLTELTPSGVPVEASVMLYKYYVANREEGRDYVVLPNQAFNAYFGTTAFSQKWTAALTGKLIEKKYSEGVSKYRLVEDVKINCFHSHTPDLNGPGQYGIKVGEHTQIVSSRQGDI